MQYLNLYMFSYMLALVEKIKRRLSATERNVFLAKKSRVTQVLDDIMKAKIWKTLEDVLH